MSHEHHSPIDNDNDEDSGFYQKSESSSDNKQNADNIPSKADAFKHKQISKRKKGHPKQSK
jgi:hypothetical protein